MGLEALIVGRFGGVLFQNLSFGASAEPVPWMSKKGGVSAAMTMPTTLDWPIIAVRRLRLSTTRRQAVPPLELVKLPIVPSSNPVWVASATSAVPLPA